MTDAQQIAAAGRVTANQHIASVSAGKDSQATMCLLVERTQRRGFGNMPPRFFFCDTDNEDQITLDHVDYLSDWLWQQIGARIETLSAYDVPALIDAEAFERKRAVILTEWPKEKRRKRHRDNCDKIIGCDCPVQVSPPVPDDVIAAAVAALQPTGNAFLDMAMLHGRFPGVKTRFCTDELKLMPMMHRKRPLLDAGINVIEWIGERADESKARAKRPAIERIRYASGASQILYRPIHKLTAADVFEISRRHGLKPNPLYLMGMNRVGCMPCIMCKKDELRQIAQRFPQHIDRLREWERIAGMVSRRTAPNPTSFFAAKMVPGDPADEMRAAIDRAVAWSRTSRGGGNYDLLMLAEKEAGEADGWLCESAYGLCE